MGFITNIKEYLLYLWNKLKDIATFSDLRAVSGAFVGLVNAFIIVTLSFMYAFSEYGILVAIPYLIGLFALYVVCATLIAYFRDYKQYGYAIILTFVLLAGYTFFAFYI